MRDETESYGEFWELFRNPDTSISTINEFITTNNINLKVKSELWLAEGLFDVASTSLRTQHLFEYCFNKEVSFTHVDPRTVAKAAASDDFLESIYYHCPSLISIRDNNGYTPIFFVNTLESCRKLSTLGAKINFITKDGKNVIDHYINRARTEKDNAAELERIIVYLREVDAFGGSGTLALPRPAPPSVTTHVEARPSLLEGVFSSAESPHSKTWGECRIC